MLNCATLCVQIQHQPSTPSLLIYELAQEIEEVEDVEELYKKSDPDTNGHDKGSDSDSSSSTSSSSSSSSKSSKSSKHSSVDENGDEMEMTVTPTRLAQTFCMKDLSNELNQTRTISKHDKSNVSIKAKKQSRTKLNTWIKPKSEVIETDGKDSKENTKLKDWISDKDAKAIEEKRKTRRKAIKETQKKQEEEEEKKKLEGLAFEKWESKKRDLLLEKIRKSDELKKKRQGKAAEMREKQVMNEKTFTSWKNNKETKIGQQKKSERMIKNEEEEEKRKEEVEKEKLRTVGFKKWCDQEKDLQKKKKAAQKVTAEIEAEIKTLEDFRKSEAEEEFLQWKKEKSLDHTELKRPEHPLGWAPAGNSKGEHRHSPKAVVPGAPLSRTLAALKAEQPHTRTLKTIDVCCRKISFWCHCPAALPQEPQYHSSILTSPTTSRPTTPVSIRPCTPQSRSRPQSAASSNVYNTPQRSSTPKVRSRRSSDI